ncbi:MAG: hypothetical protein ABI823_01295 [Bryobacteraceae bacterium]
MKLILILSLIFAVQFPKVADLLRMPGGYDGLIFVWIAVSILAISLGGGKRQRSRAGAADRPANPLEESSFAGLSSFLSPNQPLQ